ncbi:NAD-dependent epimerase/dehydratase family protein [Candidatus Poriferisodalis sp.]|uniref:NAD-dependent epimerase/dehydratase family protein n=1 Tax=Candidatus Poriferisodalis sp. TaxID=3101277 RepID=UPI003B59CA03
MRHIEGTEYPHGGELRIRRADEWSAHRDREFPTAVVTGAAGFIGSHLVDHLLLARHRVVGIDSFEPWYNPARKASNLEAACAHSSFRMEVKDLRSADLNALLRGASTVYHLAAQPGVQHSWGVGLAKTMEMNVSVTGAVLDAAAQVGVDRVVLASSSSVYGDSARTGGPNVVAPISPYGVSKVACEHLADAYRQRGLDVVTLRYFTVFGPRQRPDMAMHKMFEATRRRGRPFTRRGSGEQSREFTFVGDVAAATVMAGSVPEARGHTFDIGGGATVSLNEVIAEVSRIAGSPVQVRTVPMPAGEPWTTAAVVDEAGKVLGWRPRTTLRGALRAQWDWHQTVRGPLTLGSLLSGASSSAGSLVRSRDLPSRNHATAAEAIKRNAHPQWSATEPILSNA